jgi:hypothetical protein
MDSEDDGNSDMEEGLLVLGLDCPSSYHDIHNLMRTAQKNEVNFVCVPLFHPRLRRYPDGTRQYNPTSLITRSDMCLERSDWTNNVVGGSSVC